MVAHLSRVLVALSFILPAATRSFNNAPPPPPWAASGLVVRNFSTTSTRCTWEVAPTRVAVSAIGLT